MPNGVTSEIIIFSTIHRISWEKVIINLVIIDLEVRHLQEQRKESVGRVASIE